MMVFISIICEGMMNHHNDSDIAGEIRVKTAYNGQVKNKTNQHKSMVPDPHPFHADPDSGFEIFAAPEPGMIFLSPNISVFM